MDGWTDGRTDRQTDGQIPPLFSETLSCSGPLPKNNIIDINNYQIYPELYQTYPELYQTYPKLYPPNRRWIG